MYQPTPEDTREWIQRLSGLAQGLRMCCRDDAFCEGVTFHQFTILDAVAERQELLLADLHGSLAVDKSTTTRLVNPLIVKGLLKRETAEHDSRAVKLVLTRKGRATHKRVLACLAGFFQRALGEMPAAQRSDLLKSIDLFISAIKQSSQCCKGF